MDSKDQIVIETLETAETTMKTPDPRIQHNQKKKKPTQVGLFLMFMFNLFWF